MPGTAPSSTEELLALRYGSPRTSPVVVVIGVVVAAAVAGLLGWIGWTAANPPVRWKLLTYQAAGPTAVDVTWEVRRSPTATVTCVVRAQDEARIDVGYAIVTLPPDGSGYVQPRYRLTTLAPAFSTDVLACAEGTEVPRAAAVPQFMPGTTPPAQLPPGRAPAP